jgi:probable F420-dependent oxidoreductase
MQSGPQSRGMKFGFHMFTRGATMTPDAIAEVAQHCEQLKFDYFGVSDHVVVSAAIDSAYPYTADGSWAGAAEGACLETLTTLGFLAHATETIRLFTSVMVVPHRHAVLAAKAIATVDVLSGGRLTIGAGAGWMREELDALGAPPYERRGAATAEYLQVFRLLWGDEEVSAFDGEFVQFKDLMFAPKPVQPGGPPIWVGGEGAAARRRAALHGDGWYPVSVNPRAPLYTVARFATGLGDVRARMEQAGRDPQQLEVGLFAPHLTMGRELQGADGERMAFTGSNDAIVDDIGTYREAGLQVLVPNLDRPELSSIHAACEQFAEIMRQSQ